MEPPKKRKSNADSTVGKLYNLFTNISKGTAFLLQGLTENDSVSHSL